MIKLGNITINKAYKGDTLITGMQFDGTDSFTYFGGAAPTPPDCPDVTSSISSYEGDANEVYDQRLNKWYMKNNLGNYEAYGVFATDITTATTYTGKLAKVGMSEYEFDGSDWVYVGEATGTTIVVRSPSYIVKDASHGFKIPLDYTASTNTKIQLRLTSTSNGGGGIFGDTGGGEQDDFRFFMSGSQYYFDRVSGRIRTTTRLLNTASYLELGNYYIKNLSTGSNLVTGTTSSYTRTSTISLGQGNSDYFTLSSLTIYTSSTLARDFIPAIDGNEICLFDKVSKTYFKSDNGSYPASGGTITEVTVQGETYWPKDYESKPAPASYEEFSSVAEMNAYECPYDGLDAIVNNDRYMYLDGQWHKNADTSSQYLTFEALESGTFTLSSGYIIDYEYSTDSGATWNTIRSNNATPTVNAGERIMFRGEIQYQQFGNFEATGRFNAIGNPCSLLDGDDFADTNILGSYAFYGLFSGNTYLVSAEHLSLAPIYSLGSYCYANMFAGCTSLTTAPELPRTVSRNSYCYRGMFSGCTSLTYIKYMQTSLGNHTSDWVSGVGSTGTFVMNVNSSISTTRCGSSYFPCGWRLVMTSF